MKSETSHEITEDDDWLMKSQSRKIDWNSQSSLIDEAKMLRR